MTADEKHIKYLEMIQTVIARLSGHGFTIKGWGTALVSLIVAFLAKDAKQEHAWIALIPTIVFWMLDAYFLSLERAFRKLYETVRTTNATDFAMAPPSWTKFILGALLWRPAITPLYFMLGMVTVIVWRGSCLVKP